MTRAIEVGEFGGLEIITDGRVQSSPVPARMDPMEFRHIVAAIDMLYRRNGVIPTVEEVRQTWKFKKTSVERAWGCKELVQALSLRGISWEPTSALSMEQMNAISLLLNPGDARSRQAKLESIGVTMTQYRAWMRNPMFKQQVDIQAEHNLGDAIPVALDSLVRNAENGDNNAIMKVLEITGRYNPQQQELQNARQVLTVFIEAMEKYVEPSVLRSVMDEVQQKTRVLAITQSLKE